MGRGKGTPAFLVGASGSGTSFHVTNAGRDALLAHLNKGVPRGFDVEPGSDLARWLILLDEKRHGRVPKSLLKKHAAALADNAKKASHVFPGMRRQLDKPRDAEADDRPFVCTVCLAPVGPGGRKTAPAKCARCYQRERRGLPEAKRSTAEPRDRSVTVQLTKSTVEQLERAAAKFKITLSTLISRVVTGEIRVDVRRPA